ncbi:RHS repeat-associated core domain-containing protein, partial [Demequina subtropica]|uniref:RHS repeat-associated core domain-containing protein n=1 Tax=Demequina subtropica TaxID=1638989 RepID=UPI000B0072D9
MTALSDFDEYGRQITIAADTGDVTYDWTGTLATDTGALAYGWLGGSERATDGSTGLMLMGVRLYNPATGLFTSVDPVPGGNTTAYAYPQDPINKTDLDGKAWGWLKKARSVAR